MCLAVPARVTEIVSQSRAVVDIGGVRRQISTALLDEVAVDDYLIIHVGYALRKLDEDEAQKTLALFADMGLLDETTAVGTPS